MGKDQRKSLFVLSVDSMSSNLNTGDTYSKYKNTSTIDV